MTKYGWRNSSINTKKLIVKGKMPMRYTIPKTVATATAAIKADWNCHTATTALTNTTILMQPPYPMILSVQAASASALGTAGHYDKIEFKGYDAKGKSIRELVAVKATAAGLCYSSNAFARITSIQPKNQQTTGAVLKAADVNIGYVASTIGLPYEIAGTSDILSYAYDGAFATTNFGSGGLKVSKAYDTLFIPTTPTAAKVISILYLSKVQQ